MKWSEKLILIYFWSFQCLPQTDILIVAEDYPVWPRYSFEFGFPFLKHTVYVVATEWFQKFHLTHFVLIWRLLPDLSQSIHTSECVYHRPHTTCTQKTVPRVRRGLHHVYAEDCTTCKQRTASRVCRSLRHVYAEATCTQRFNKMPAYRRYAREPLYTLGRRHHQWWRNDTDVWALTTIINHSFQRAIVTTQQAMCFIS